MMPCVFGSKVEAKLAIIGTGTPIMCFGEEWSADGNGRQRLKAKFNYKKIRMEEVQRFADSLGFK